MINDFDFAAHELSDWNIKNFKNILITLNHPRFLTLHLRYTNRLKRKEALRNIAGGVFIIILFGGLGFTSLSFNSLLMLTIVFFLLTFLGLAITSKNIIKLIKISKPKISTSIRELCNQYYPIVFCKASSNTESKRDQIVKLCHLFPFPVINIYTTDKSLHNMLGGLDGLGRRWESCRNNVEEADRDFVLSNITVEESLHDDFQVVDIIVKLNWEPFGSIKFKNVALNIDGNFFLLTPEPVVL